MDLATPQRKSKRRLRKFRLFLRIMLIVFVLIALSLVALLSYTRMQGPPPIEVAQTTQFYGVDNTVIGNESEHGDRYSVSLEEISPSIIDATISIEDRKFFSHYGFDPMRIGGAILANIQSGSRSQGASTLTQQYARNLYLSHDKTWLRKWNELLYSLRLEMNFSKEEILSGYLNTVYYGHGAYGIEAAALHYFDTSAKDVSLAQGAMLAGIPKGPSYYSPEVDFDRAKARQELILDSMVETGAITEAEAAKAKAEPIELAEPKEEESVKVGPYFQDMVKHRLVEDIGLEEEVVDAGGLHVYTTLDPAMQAKAERIVEEEMPASELQTALVAIDPRDGEVRAMVGGTDYEESSYNRATQASRAPGSTMKPLLYYAALTNGFTPMSTFLSEATSFTYDDGREEYEPGNFNDIYADDYITMLEAIAYSDNIYAVKTHLSIGGDELVHTADAVGLHGLLDHPSLALGAQEVNILDMTNAYVPLANGGNYGEASFITRVEDASGDVIYEQEPTLEPTLDEDVTFVLTNLMQAMFEPELNSYTSVTGGSLAGELNRPVAGKSGSTPGDSWMIGYTPQLVTGVWVGYDQGKNITHAAEGQISKHIWSNFLNEALEDELTLPFKEPDGVVAAEIDPHTGLLANDACPGGRTTYFLEGTAPVEACTEPDAADEMQKEPEEPEEGFFDRLFKWISADDDDGDVSSTDETEEEVLE
ncbi:transglycosylase domain-containing protein [Shouchella shacheensis]|uniref:transglycosylase domain-containing protein n=1 Tax=Shouchella shacheensis TaxID=1649580 RepID=UPI0009EA9DF3|nr:PBP1A family penicillin-binding protein [Shouchella shacheensis]